MSDASERSPSTIIDRRSPLLPYRWCTCKSPNKRFEPRELQDDPHEPSSGVLRLRGIAMSCLISSGGRRIPGLASEPGLRCWRACTLVERRGARARELPGIARGNRIGLLSRLGLSLVCWLESPRHRGGVTSEIGRTGSLRQPELGSCCTSVHWHKPHNQISQMALGNGEPDRGWEL